VTNRDRDDPRYTNPEMGAIWSDQRRYETWLEVELRRRRDGEAGSIPRDAARDCAQARVRHRRIEEIERSPSTT
jgi:adenylosuccinate lyase